MNKQDLITAMAEKSGLTKKDAEKALGAFEASVTEELVSGGKVQLVGFGTFDVADRKERIGRNPQDGKEMTIPASKAVRFSVGKTLKDTVNK